MGYGVNGRNLARAARAANIGFRVVEINAETVIKEKAEGIPIMFGDATQETVLKTAGVEEAKMIVIAIHDAAATRRVTSQARRLNPTLHILVRTRFVADMKDLHQLGANEVIPEEYETSIEIFSRVLARYLVPRDIIEKMVDEVRKQDYGMFRSLRVSSLDLFALNRMHLHDAEISAVKVGEHTPLAGKSIQELDLRNLYGVSVLAIQRGNEIISNPGANDEIQATDSLVVLGSLAATKEVARMLV